MKRPLLYIVGWACVVTCVVCCGLPPETPPVAKSLPPESKVEEKIGEVELAGAFLEIDIEVGDLSGRNNNALCDLPVTLFAKPGYRHSEGASHQIRIENDHSLALTGEQRSGLMTREIWRAPRPEQRGDWYPVRIPREHLPGAPFKVWSATDCVVILGDLELPPSRGNEHPRVYPYVLVRPTPAGR